jgi:hypothetical protein
MPGRFFACLLFSACLLAAPPKTVATATGENRDLALTVTLYIDPAGVKELIGNDLDGHYIVADIKIEPKNHKEVSIDLGDFLLRTDQDGDKATPYAPSQIAGQGALVVREVHQGHTPGMANATGGGHTFPTGVTTQNADADRQDPLEQTLKDKELPEKKTDQPISGLLYFVMEKQKMKDLELIYGARDNRISLRFK